MVGARTGELLVEVERKGWFKWIKKRSRKQRRARLKVIRVEGNAKKKR